MSSFEAQDNLETGMLTTVSQANEAGVSEEDVRQSFELAMNEYYRHNTNQEEE